MIINSSVILLIVFTNCGLLIFYKKNDLEQYEVFALIKVFYRPCLTARVSRN